MEAGVLHRSLAAAESAPKLLRLKSDATLCNLAREGHEQAFEAIYDRHQATILAFSRKMLGDAYEAEDVVQHTFIAAYRELQRSEGPMLLRPWLFTVARNRCLQLLRDRKEQPAEELETQSVEAVASLVERRQALRDVFGDVRELPEQQRAALVLSELEAMSHEDIASQLGVPRARVKALVFQARSTLVASRTARETPCVEIRSQLAEGGPGVLRRGEIRRHLRECTACEQYRDTIHRRRGLAALLPAAPAAGWLAKLAAAAAVVGSGASTATVVAVVAGVPLGGLLGSHHPRHPQAAVPMHKLVHTLPAWSHPVVSAPLTVIVRPRSDLTTAAVATSTGEHPRHRRVSRSMPASRPASTKHAHRSPRVASAVSAPTANPAPASAPAASQSPAITPAVPDEQVVTASADGSSATSRTAQPGSGRPPRHGGAGNSQGQDNASGQGAGDGHANGNVNGQDNGNGHGHNPHQVASQPAQAPAQSPPPSSPPAKHGHQHGNPQPAGQPPAAGNPAAGGNGNGQQNGQGNGGGNGHAHGHGAGH
jgi:RNA polymerase sigma factor (sigma-70 family)